MAELTRTGSRVPGYSTVEYDIDVGAKGSPYFSVGYVND